MKFDDPSSMPLPAQPVRSLAAEQNSTAIFYGWRVVLVSALGLFWGIAIAVYSFSVFFKPLMQEFHAGRATVSLGFTVQLLVGALSAAPAGWLIDRFGPHRVIMTGTAIFGLILVANRLFTFRVTGAQSKIGLELHSIFQSAGLPAPTLRLDAAVGAGLDTPAYKMLPEIVRSLLPAMETWGIATAAEVEVESFALRIRDEVVANNGIVISPSLIGAWAMHETAAIKGNDKARHTNK